MKIMSADGSTPSKKKAVVLTSGGKDSILALHLAVESGLEVMALLTIFPEDEESLLYHTHNLEHVGAIADSIGVKWISKTVTKDEEVTSLSGALTSIEAEVLVTGGVASNFQREKFAKAAKPADLEIFTPLWGMSAQRLFSMILEKRLKVVVDAVAALGLGEEWLGVELTRKNIERLMKISEKFRFNPVGEGGDLDTFVLDAPLYNKKLIIQDVEKCWYGDRGVLKIDRLAGELKP